MKTHGETIEIKAPPVEMLHKKNPSCLKRGCATSFGCFFIFIIAAILGLKSLATPNTVKSGLPPKNIESFIPVYDADAIETVSFTKQSNTFRRLRTNTFFVQGTTFLKKYEQGKHLVFWDNKTYTDGLTIHWTRISASPSFVFRYYQDELKKAGFAVHVTENTDTVKEIIFTKQRPLLQGTIVISDTNKANGTDTVTLTVRGDLSSL